MYGSFSNVVPPSTLLLPIAAGHVNYPVTRRFCSFGSFRFTWRCAGFDNEFYNAVLIRREICSRGQCNVCNLCCTTAHFLIGSVCVVVCLCVSVCVFSRGNKNVTFSTSTPRLTGPFGQNGDCREVAFVAPGKNRNSCGGSSFVRSLLKSDLCFAARKKRGSTRFHFARRSQVHFARGANCKGALNASGARALLLFSMVINRTWPRPRDRS